MDSEASSTSDEDSISSIDPFRALDVLNHMFLLRKHGLVGAICDSLDEYMMSSLAPDKDFKLPPRAYARGKLNLSDDTNMFRDDCAAYFADLAETEGNDAISLLRQGVIRDNCFKAKCAFNRSDVLKESSSGIIVRGLPLFPCGFTMDEDHIVLYHYTSFKAFLAICQSQEIWATILEQSKNKYDTCFGDGVYVTQYPPDHFGSQEMVLRNNYTNKVYKDPAEDHIYKHPISELAQCCVPLIVPRDVAWNVMIQATSSMTYGPGINRHGKPVRQDRDIWVIIITTPEDSVMHATENFEAMVHRIGFVDIDIDCNTAISMAELLTSQPMLSIDEDLRAFAVHKLTQCLVLEYKEQEQELYKEETSDEEASCEDVHGFGCWLYKKCDFAICLPRISGLPGSLFQLFALEIALQRLHDSDRLGIQGLETGRALVLQQFAEINSKQWVLSALRKEDPLVKQAACEALAGPHGKNHSLHPGAVKAELMLRALEQPFKQKPPPLPQHVFENDSGLEHIILTDFIDIAKKFAQHFVHAASFEGAWEFAFLSPLSDVLAGEVPAYDECLHTKPSRATQKLRIVATRMHAEVFCKTFSSWLRADSIYIANRGLLQLQFTTYGYRLRKHLVPHSKHIRFLPSRTRLHDGLW